MLFNCLVQERQEFRSNPPLPDSPVTIPEQDENGNIRNKVVLRPLSNVSLFDGVSYNRDTMSLRAQLNMGAKLTEVSMPSLYSDPLRPYQRMLQVEQAISSQIQSLESQESNNESIVESNS